MMDQLITKATITKARAMYGKRLKLEDYRELMHRSSVAEVADYLKRNTHYKELLSGVDTNTIHRGFLEDLIKRHGMERYQKLCNFQHLDKIAFYNYEIYQREVEEIVAAIMHLNSGDGDNYYIDVLPAYLLSHASFDLMALAKTTTFKALLNVLAKTPYRKLLEHEQPDENGKYNCAKIEIVLRSAYIEWMKDAVDKCFGKKEAAELHVMIKEQVDLINAINSFRIKVLADAGAEVSELGTLPYYEGKSRRKQEYLMESKDPSEYINRLQHSFYGRQMMQFEEGLTKDNLEHTVLTLRFRLTKRRFRTTVSTAVSFYSILYLFSVEEQNLINIIEGIRYQVPISYLERMVVL